MIRHYGERPYGYRGAPKPPPHIWARLEDAGRRNDPIALAAATTDYRAWLEDRRKGRAR